MTTLDELEALAKEATPGEWLTTKRSVYVLHSVDPVDGGEVVCQPKRAVDTRFIAAANPTTILTLIALVRLQHESMLAVLCDPEGTPCFDGSNGDREVIAEALYAFDHFEQGEV